MRRREFLNTAAISLGLLRERLAAQAQGDRNIRWAASMFLWTSTQWKNDGSARFTDMLDVLRDAGLNGFRLTGWPSSLKKFNMPEAVLEKELSKRNLEIATLTFIAPGHQVSEQPRIRESAKLACEFLRRFGTKNLAVFSGQRPEKVLIQQLLPEACKFYNEIGDICAEYGIRAGLHNHLDQLVESQEEVELMLKLTNPRQFGWAPDTIHLHLAGANVVQLFEKYGHRLNLMDYVDAKYTYAGEKIELANGLVEKPGAANGTFMLSNQDLGDGVLDFPALHRVLKKNRYKGWIVIDHHYTPISPLHSFTRCRQYIRNKLEPIYS
jgi:sugar phosphate isomerase/epimerase